MALFTLRKPPVWSYLFVATLPAGLAFYALRTDVFPVIGRFTASKMIYKATDPDAFKSFVIGSVIISFYCCTAALIKITDMTPLVTNFLAKTYVRLESKIVRIGRPKKRLPNQSPPQPSAGRRK